ncbi:predicted protein [Streptomyces sviceus ATCC 29083]|uniref:C2H2-type domain-containing protein n=1 Tax=Streptomyces sviceus (strain ATCC 29083 / DSM 924 / JCM 4929 / NBRC 13980 / NCIMB 11184 / NRRL 5439 / UC 5370) TaxID=463191 RepID=D6XBQ8_STRX2|nr:predicted protein [Streptomyces sviceus ATCC 29083]
MPPRAGDRGRNSSPREPDSRSPTSVPPTTRAASTCRGSRPPPMPPPCAAGDRYPSPCACRSIESPPGQPPHHAVRTMYQCPVCGPAPSGRRERHTYRFHYKQVTHPRQTNVRGVTLSFIHAGRHGWAGAAEHFRRSFCCWRWTRPRVPPHSRSRSTSVWPERS